MRFQKFNVPDCEGIFCQVIAVETIVGNLHNITDHGQYIFCVYIEKEYNKDYQISAIHECTTLRKKCWYSDVVLYYDNGKYKVVKSRYGKIRDVYAEPITETETGMTKEQPIESLLSEKKDLEEKIKNVDKKISEHKENVLNNLVPGEWYKIKTDYSKVYYVRKFVKYVDRGDGEIYLLTKIPTGQDDSTQKNDIQSIIHIPGAKEAEETFLNILKG